jgi:hypothetical protein
VKRPLSLDVDDVRPEAVFLDDPIRAVVAASARWRVPRRPRSRRRSPCAPAVPRRAAQRMPGCPASPARATPTRGPRRLPDRRRRATPRVWRAAAWGSHPRRGRCVSCPLRRHSCWSVALSARPVASCRRASAADARPKPPWTVPAHTPWPSARHGGMIRPASATQLGCACLRRSNGPLRGSPLATRLRSAGRRAPDPGRNRPGRGDEREAGAADRPSPARSGGGQRRGAHPAALRRIHGRPPCSCTSPAAWCAKDRAALAASDLSGYRR